MIEDNDKTDRDYLEKSSNIQKYSFVSFIVASIYQFQTINNKKTITKMPLKIGTCILTGGLSYGITYLALKNIYEL